MPARDGSTRPDAGITSLGLTALAAKPKEDRTPAEQKVLEQGIPVAAAAVAR